jgi:esterase/lipase superfamily enzyme
MIFVRIILLGSIFSACATTPYEINLMPAPAVYTDGVLDPFRDTSPINPLPYTRLFYATDRLPTNENEPNRFYSDERAGVVRLGVARIASARANITWEEARRISLAKNRTDKYPIRVSGVEEWGILDRSATMFTPPDAVGEDPHAAARAFATAVNAKLAQSRRKDIFIYTHGYKVVFESPVLVATELWHFLGYDGVFIAYAWPSTPSRWAYFRDVETAAGVARNFRLFLEYLAAETAADRIHIIGYSAGTRLVARALEQLALLNDERAAEEIFADLRIDHVILVGSDVDRQVFAAYLADGLLKVPRHLSVYVSEKDSALSLARFLTRRERLGQMWSQELNASVADYLYQNEAEVSVINVTEAKWATGGNGHAYFRQSPWASSDILATLAYDLSPADRGLVRTEDSPVWRFPADYIKRLRVALIKNNPELAPARENTNRE